jgi:hypothetical protein
MSFARYIAGDILLFLLAVLTLPLWLPFWLWVSFRNWFNERRFFWECEEIVRKNDERAKRAAGVAIPVPAHAHHWRDFGSLGGRNVVWCSGCDSLAFTGQEPDGVALPAEPVTGK